MRHLPRWGLSRRRFLSGTGAVAAGITLSPRLGWGAEEKKLNLYNWDTYLGENTLADFKKSTGIEVALDLYADNDELFAKLQAGNPGYDVIVPTDNYVERMIRAGMLTPIDRSKIPNFKNVAPEFQVAAFDPGRKHSMPYTWGTVGIGYRKSKVKGTPDSWKWILDSDQYSGRISLLSEGITVIGMALKYLGYKLNTTDPAALKKAEALLIKQKPHIKVIAGDNGQDLLVSGEVDLAMEWNGDIVQVMSEDKDIGYALPKEGGLLWQDNLCIPKGAPHPENAHAFINFMLDADVAADVAETIGYATPNAAAKAKARAEYRNDPAIWPPQAALDKCEVQLYLGPEATRLYDETWTRIKAA